MERIKQITNLLIELTTNHKKFEEVNALFNEDFETQYTNRDGRYPFGSLKFGDVVIKVRKKRKGRSWRSKGTEYIEVQLVKKWDTKLRRREEKNPMDDRLEEVIDEFLYHAKRHYHQEVYKQKVRDNKRIMETLLKEATGSEYGTHYEKFVDVKVHGHESNGGVEIKCTFDLPLDTDSDKFSEIIAQFEELTKRHHNE